MGWAVDKHASSMHGDSIYTSTNHWGAKPLRVTFQFIVTFGARFFSWFIRQVSDKEAKPDLVQTMQWHRCTWSVEEIAES
jgi:hypothetical protein